MAILQPEREDRLRGAWNTDPDTATDAQSRAAARTLAREVLTAQTIAEMPEEQFKTEDERYGAAAKMVELMTGEKDYDGRLWNGSRGFKTGAEYLRSVKETLTRGMGAAADPELQAWLRMSDEEKDSLVESQRGILSHVGEGAGDVASAAGELVRGVPRLSKDEYSSAPEDVRRASDAMGSVMWDAIPENQRSEYEAKVRDWRGGEWQRLKRRGEYEAKLRRKNALLYLPDMIKSLKSDEAKALAGELAQNPSEMPRDWTARLEKLPTRDIETLAQIRGMTREHVEGGFFNWLGDMAGGVYNGAHGILSGMGAQEAKIAAMAMGWDGERVNEMINRKHALWSAYAGWSSPVAQLSDEHGAVANFTIGLASAVPFIASMHLKGLGYIACASEMMSEADAQAAAAGIDTTNPAYVARSAVAGGLYAYMLKAVSPKFLGASANGAAEDIAMRTAFMKGVMSGVAKLDTLKVMSQRTASGALMMAMQQGIAAVNEDLNLGGDAWRDAAQRFTETFVSSIPDMLAFSAHGALEGHARASGGWRKMFTAEGRANRSQNLREAVENAFAVRTAVDGNARIDALRTNTALAQIAAMRRAWTEGGEKGLARLGFKPEEIAEAKDFFEAERKALGAAEKLDALERATDAESLEEIAEDAPLAERNDAARRFDEANGEYTRAVERLAETLRGKTADAPGVVRDLEAVRNVWAQGNAVGAGRSDGTDAGAAALVKAGFAPEDAAALSKAFGAERRGMYSPAATEALRGLYTRSTRGRVEATAALASAFGGRMRTIEGRTYIDLPMPDGGTGTLAVETVDLSQRLYGESGSDPEMARQVERATGGMVKADDWIAMDDAARREIVKRHRLMEEGDFQVTDPADPSLHISSGDADAVMGVIRLDPTADPGAAFHEAMHGFLRFCKETGFFDAADLKWLTDTYGRPENPREQLNEESAANGFRQYLAKRMAGAITDEPGPFRKLFGLIGRLRHLREARAATERLATNAEEALYDAFLAGRYQHIRDLTFAEPKPQEAPKAEAGAGTEAPQTGAKPKAEESPAENAEAQRVVSELPHVEVPRRAASYGEARQLLKAEAGKPFTNAKSGIKASLSGNSINKILSGKAVAKSVGVKQHLAAAANIVSLFEGGELRATEEGNRKGVEAAKRIFARFDLDGESLVAKITVLEHGNGDNRIYSVEAMEVAKAGSILAPKDSTSQAENPALPSTPRIITQSGGENKGENSPRVVRWEAQTPRGNKYVGGYYKVFKLSDLVHSNDPRYKAHAALQGRNRVDNKLEESDRVRIKAEFNGRRYLDNEVTSDGAPIIVMLPDAEGVTRPFVLSGNGRVLVLNDLAESHLYDRYRNPLKEWAAKNGVEMDVADADNPVLVRVLDDLKGSNLLEVSRLSNVRTSTPPTETELARTDAEYLRSLDLARLYHANADGSPDMTPGVNDEFFRKFSQGPDAETTFDEKNNVGESAQRRIMRAFLHLAVGDSPRGLAAAEKLITMSGTYGIDRQKGALQMMAPGVARTEGNTDYAIGPDVARAIADFMDFTEMRRAGKIGKLDDYIAQGDMFDQPSEIAADILRTLAEGRGTARDMAERVNAYAEIAAHSDADGALGGAANARSRADVWREAKGLAEQRIAERTPKTRFSIRSEADGKKDEEKKSVVARVQPSEQGQNRPAHLRNDTTQRTLTPESAAPVREFGESISQSGVKSPADFLTGLVHALGSEETNPDKTQYFDITHEDGKNLSLRVANHRATARFYRERGNAADVKTSVVVKMSDKPFYGDNGVELTEHVYFSDRLTAEREAAIASGVAEWIRTGEWHGPAADQVNMSPHRRFSIAGRSGAENMGLKGAAEAEAMEKTGADREDIWRKTGWWRGKDGKWRVEIPDVKRKGWHGDPEERHFTGGGEDFYRYKLTELIEDGDFLKAYPQARKITVEFHKNMPANVGGNFNEATLTIKLPQKYQILTDYAKAGLGEGKAASLNEAGRKTIVHELQHAIQLFESFVKGGSPSDPVRPYALDGNTGHALSVFAEANGMDVTNDRHLAIIANTAQKITSDATRGEMPKRLVEAFEAAAKEAGKTPEEFRDEIERLYDSHTESPMGQYFKLAGEVEARNVEARLGMTAEQRAATPPWETEDVPSSRQIIRYSIAGGIGAANMGIKGAADAEAMEKAGLGREEIWRTTGWWRGRDGQWRVELPPIAIDEQKLKQLDINRNNYNFRKRKAQPEYHARLEDLIADKQLVAKLNAAYGTLPHISVVDDVGWALGRFHPETNSIDIHRHLTAAEMRSVLEHELQHFIQHKEGFTGGGDNTGGEYRNLTGEVEARNVQKRLAMSPEERAATPPWKTEDVPADRQIVRYSIVSLAGRDVAVVDDLDAARSINPTMPADVEKYILDHLEDGIQMMAGGTASINAETARHFAWSKVRGKYNTNRRMRKARAQSAIVFRDLVEMFKADDTTKQEDYHKQGDEVWKCRLPFGVPQFESSSEKIAGGIVYDADVIIKDTGDGKFLYDVADLKRNEALTQQLTSQAQDLFGGGKRAVETVSARAPGEAPTLTAKSSLDSDLVQRLYGSTNLTGESATSAPEGAPHNIPKPSDEIKADPESFARRSVVARATEGEAEEKESALVAFVAERALRHGPKPNAIKTIGRLGLEMGLKMVDTKRIITKGEALAERVRGTVIEKAVRNGDVATATALLAREADIDNLVAGAAGQGGQLVRRGEGKIKSILDREIEKTVRSFNAASLADVERDTGIDIAGEILANSPEKFDPKGAAKRPVGEAPTDGAADAEGSAPGDSSPGEGNLTDYEIARRQRVRKEAEERVAKMIATAKERSEATKKEHEEWEAKREERKRRAEEAAASGEDGGGDSGEGGGEDGGGEGAAPGDHPKLSTWADFKTPEEFAAFFRVWAEDRYKKEHGTSTIGKHEEKRLFPEFYRKAAVRELQDLAYKLLPPKGARATVNRWLGEIQPGVKPDTLERVSADVFAYINRNAIREGRTAQIQKFRNGLQEFVKGPQFDDLKLDADRRVTGWVEEAARYIRRVCNLSIQSINGEPSQLEKERAELQAILDRRERVYDDEGKNAADAPKFDMETRRALAKLQLLEKYGAMKRYMPGEIADLADEAMRWLQDEAVKLEAAWKDAREAEDSIRGALAGGIVGPNGQKYKRGDGVGAWFDGLFDSLNGMIRLRLQHLVRFADSAHQQKAKDAINRVVVMLGDGEVAFARHLQDDRMAFHNALNAIFTDRATGKFDRRACADWLNRMTEAIPTDLSRKLSTQGYADSMTYGQMLQLLVSLEQKSYAEAIRTNGRDGQADLIRTFETVGPDGRRERVLTDKDILFIDWLRSFYEAKRGMLSEVTKRMTGLPVDSPDPLYCPVKMYMGDQGRGMHVDSSAAWDPIGAVFSRRMANVVRDFDESASILGQFFDRSAASANLVAWGERGSIIRGVFTDAGVQQSIRLAFGGGELTKILKQLEETFNGGENISKAPGEIAAADKAMNWMTYLSLGYNPLSAMKQTTSFTVWANALPGGFRDLWRYMTDVDMATIKHIKESEAYKVRYGNEVGSGHDVASKGLFENPSENPVAAFFRKTSMGLLRKGDFLPGGWIAQGVFRDLYNRHLKDGMDADAADRLAMTETFNMLEETQQSGRTYNTAELAREHGRLGRLLVQFATSPLQQLQYETQAVREVRDLLRYKPSTPDADFEKRYSEAKGKLVRAAVINHVLLPAALHAVTNIYRLAMGYDPEWEKEGWHWSLLRDITLGQFSRVFFLGAISSVTTDVLITGKPVREIPALIPAEGVVKLFANMTVTARDIATLNYEQVQKDLDRLLKSTSITRTPYDVVRLLTGKAYAEREERREKRRQKDTKK